MPFPFQAALPLVIVSATLAATGMLMDWTHRVMNNGKPQRVLMTPWHKRMIERDERLLGRPNVQYVCALTWLTRRTQSPTSTTSSNTQICLKRRFKAPSWFAGIVT